jgi:hypothetical protein
MKGYLLKILDDKTLVTFKRRRDLDSIGQLFFEDIDGNIYDQNDITFLHDFKDELESIIDTLKDLIGIENFENVTSEAENFLMVIEKNRDAAELGYYVGYLDGLKREVEK